MVFIDNYIFNKDVYVQFNSTVGEYVGYTAHGVYNAQLFNNNPNLLQQVRAQVETYCKPNAKILQSAIADKTGQWHTILISPVIHNTHLSNHITFTGHYAHLIIIWKPVFWWCHVQARRRRDEDLDAANLIIIIKQQQQYIENKAGNKGKRNSL